MKRILILTAGFGDGHNAAAQNVREALEQISPDVEVTVADLYERSHRRLNAVARKAYLGMVRYAPGIWSGVFKLLDCAPWLADGSRRLLGGLERALIGALEMAQPDCVVCTYPTYPQLIDSLFRDQFERPFRIVTIITDARSVNSVWHRSPSDAYVVSDAQTAAVLAAARVPEEKIHALGFPVSPRFARPGGQPPKPPMAGEPFRALYAINTGKKKAGKIIDRLLEIAQLELTVVAGRRSELKETLAKRAGKRGRRLHLLGWTNQMPEIMMGSHLVIAKAGGATVQEAIAAKCPILINQVIPGQEEGNARLVEELGIGAVAEKKRELARRVQEALDNDGALWRIWRQRLETISRPDASLRIAQFLLEECERANRCAPPEKLPACGSSIRASRASKTRNRRSGRPLLCDFHIHTNYSDGKLTVPEAVDFYGARGFDCICITDHWTDTRRLIGKLQRLTPFTLSADQIDEYFAVIEREARRAMRRYGMLVLAGLEFNKDGATKKSSAHLLGVDLKSPISPRLDLRETIEQIHAQGGLAVASHPHLMKSEWAKDTLYLWDNQEEFIPLIDAWEIANRNNLFAPVSLKRLPFLANSDFHKPKHIYSWKTVLHCRKDAEAIKRCIRRNRGISITLYRDESSAELAQLEIEDSRRAKADSAALDAASADLFETTALPARARISHRSAFFGFRNR